MTHPRPGRSRARPPRPDGGGYGATDAAPPLGTALEFLRTLWSIDHGLAQMSARMEARLGVTGPQRLAIRIVARREGIGPADLALMLHVHRSAATGLVRRLEAKGLIRREVDRGDGRRWRLTLTAEGRRVDELDHGTVESRVRRVLEDSSKQEVAVAARLLDRLAGALSVDDA